MVFSSAVIDGLASADRPLHQSQPGQQKSIRNLWVRFGYLDHSSERLVSKVIAVGFGQSLCKNSN